MASVHQKTSVAALLVATVLSGLGCLPRGPISISLESLLPPCDECQREAEANHGSPGRNSPPMAMPWQHYGPPGAAAADGSVTPPHSMFHPVPTRPVFTPWIVDEPPPAMPASPAPSHSTNVGKPILSREPDSSAIGTAARPATRRSPPPPINLDPDDKQKSPGGGSSVMVPTPRAAGGVASGGWRGTDLE